MAKIFSKTKIKIYEEALEISSIRKTVRIIRKNKKRGSLKKIAEDGSTI